jgi:hypothetical protein
MVRDKGQHIFHGFPPPLVIHLTQLRIQYSKTFTFAKQARNADKRLPVPAFRAPTARAKSHIYDTVRVRSPFAGRSRAKLLAKIIEKQAFTFCSWHAMIV